MTKLDEKAISLVMDAIKKETFRPTEVMSVYSVDQIAAIIIEIITSKRVSETDFEYKVELTEIELNNLLFLARTILNKRAIETKKTFGSAKKQRKNPLFSTNLLSSMYKLQAA